MRDGQLEKLAGELMICVAHVAPTRPQKLIT
jgi:hypothetical protein